MCSTFQQFIIPKIHINVERDLQLVEESIEKCSVFYEMRDCLSRTKSLLDKYSSKDYTSLSRTYDVYRELRSKVSMHFRGQVVTNAWLKMFEMLSCCCDIFPKKSNPINFFFNAELPGAFIAATNHYMKTHKKDYEWVASSYVSDELKDTKINDDKPSSPMTDDRKQLGDCFGFYKLNKEHWLMGEETSGNLLNITDIVGLVDKLHERYPDGADFYTSDAGIDASEDYNSQEELFCLLNFGQIITGLCSLAIGGTMITKQYTFFTPFSRSLIAIVSSFFERTYIVKPRTSRRINSEIYIVAVGFKDITQDEGMKLLLMFKSLVTKKDIHKFSLLDYDCFKEIDHELFNFANELFINKQCSAIKEMVSFASTEDMTTYVEKVTPTVVFEWLSTCKPIRISKDDHITCVPCW